MVSWMMRIVQVSSDNVGSVVGLVFIPIPLASVCVIEAKPIMARLGTRRRPPKDLRCCRCGWNSQRADLAGRRVREGDDSCGVRFLRGSVERPFAILPKVCSIRATSKNFGIL